VRVEGPEQPESKACSELGRFLELLANAVASLMRSFEKIGELLEAQNRLLEESLNPDTGAKDLFLRGSFLENQLWP